MPHPRHRPPRRLIVLGLLTLACTATSAAERGIGAAAPVDPLAALAACQVAWDAPSADSRGSMPLGNGDIGMNVWAERNGDLLCYISKTDAWTDNVAGGKGLAKLGRVRVTLTPNPFAEGQPFRQVLDPATGEIVITAGAGDAATTLRVWVDANHPVIRIETMAAKPGTCTVQLDPWRTTAEKNLNANTVVTDQAGRIAWYYRNLNQQVPQLTNLTFGAVIAGEGLTGSGTTLTSTRPAVGQRIAIHPLTAQTDTPGSWLAQATRQADATTALDLEATRTAHRAWWKGFWERSWIQVGGDEDASRVTRGYALQRFISACAGRGAYPLKFNGSIFTVDYQTKQKVDGVEKQITMDADSRAWGGQYWFQNTRPMYWPMLASGDFDMMQPLFRMFRAILPNNAKLVKAYYGHDGAYFAETKPFWGGLDKLTAEMPGSYTKHYYTPILELSAMMLDYVAYTGDQAFARDTLLPIADAGVTFFDQHFKRGPDGKLLIDPANSIEMYWKAKNPTPDIAGLMTVLRGLLALPTELTTAEQRSRWQRLQGELPAIPLGTKDGRKTVLAAEEIDKGHNSENPELYTVYPFRLFGLGKPDLELALNAFALRRYRTMGCWSQDGIQAALLGQTEVARKNALFALTRQDKQLRFPAFWDPGHDYAPDQDNGGNGVNTLQTMLIQNEGRRIVLLPAWPATWSASFRLHAALNTTVDGEVRDGHLVGLTVTPAARRADVEMIGADGRLTKVE